MDSPTTRPVRRSRLVAGATLLLGLALHPVDGDAGAAPLEVVAVQPPLHALAVDPERPVFVLFDREVDAATLDGGGLTLFGRWSGPVGGTIDAAGAAVRFSPAAPLAPGDAVTLRLAPDVAASDGEPLGRPFSSHFWTAAGAAGATFVEEGELVPGDVPYGAHGGDLDHDGDLDLAVPNEGSDDLAVYLNDGTGAYGPRTTWAAGSVPSPIEAADLDGDGHVDLVVANTASDDVSVYLGRGDGTFDDQVRYPAGDNPRGIGFTDLDRDGDLDVLVANRSSGDLSLLRAHGDGTFDPERRLPTPGSGETAVVAVDMDGDGLEDLVVGHHGSDEVRTYLALPAGGFTPGSTSASGGSVWQMAVGDLDGDGLPDAVTANFDSDTAGVLLATGPGTLADATTYPVGNGPIAIDVGDLDGDGDLDLVTSNFFGGTWTIYSNRGDGTFADRRELPARVTGSCAVLHDRDGDGDLDLTAIDEEADRVILYRND